MLSVCPSRLGLPRSTMNSTLLLSFSLSHTAARLLFGTGSTESVPHQISVTSLLSLPAISAFARHLTFSPSLPVSTPIGLSDPSPSDITADKACWCCRGAILFHPSNKVKVSTSSCPLYSASVRHVVHRLPADKSLHPTSHLVVPASTSDDQYRLNARRSTSACQLPTRITRNFLPVTLS